MEHSYFGKALNSLFRRPGGMTMSMEYIRKYYKVPAKRGAKVRVTSSHGKDIKFDGTIVASEGAYLRIKINGKVGTYHPTWNIEYL